MKGMEVQRTLEFLLEQQAKTDAEIAMLDSRVSGLLMILERGVRLQEKQSEHLENLIDAKLKFAEVDGALDDRIVQVANAISLIRTELSEQGERFQVLLEIVNGMVRPKRKTAKAAAASASS